jgi:glycosyltransferase involved in cell wall biosynthesis
MANNFPWPGKSDGIFNLRQAQALRELGHEIRVLRCMPWAPPIGARWQLYRTVPTRYAVEGIPVQTLRVFLGPRNWGIGTLPRQLRNPVGRAVAEFKPDVIHVHGLLPAGLMALDAGVPFVLTAHGTETYRMPWRSPQLERLARSVVASASACAGVSGFVASHLLRLGARETSVVFNGADETVFHPRDRREARARLGLPVDRPTVVFAGHVDPPKGVRELQEAALKLADLHPHFVFAGGGTLQDELARVLPAAGIEVTFFPWLDHEKLADVVAAADVFTLPSHAEGLPTALCETMNVGRAIVATGVGGIPEIVKDGETGFIVDVGDVSALADRLRKILTDGALRERFEAAALEFARAHLTWRVNARSYDAIYRRIVASNRLSAGAGADSVVQRT